MAKNAPIHIILGLASLSALSSLAITMTQHGCSSRACAYDERTPDTPSPSVDCPAGNLCYIGECLRSCNAGAERSVPCSTDSDCKDRGRPHCILADAIAGTFCSTCEEGEACILGLNICQKVSEIPDPDPPGMPMFQPPPLPLDGGQLDATTFEADASEPGEQQTNDTHVGSIVFEEIVDFGANGGMSTRQPFACVDFADVRNADVVAERSVLLAAGDCDLVQPRLFRSRNNTRATPGPVNACERRRGIIGYPEGVMAANVGQVTVSAASDTPEAMNGSVTLAFVDARSGYLSGMMVTEPLFQLSRPRVSGMRAIDRYLNLEGTSEPGISGEWPRGRDGEQIHVPYELTLSAASMARLSRPIDIESPPQDVELSWERLSVNTEVPGERIYVRVFSEQSSYVYIQCQVAEATGMNPSIRIVGTLLQAFKERAGTLPAEIPISISRTLVRRLDIPSGSVDAGMARDDDAGTTRTSVNGSLAVSHTFIGRLRF